MSSKRPREETLPRYYPSATLSWLDKTIVASLRKPHLYKKLLVPPRRIALIYGQPGDEKFENIVAFLQVERELAIKVKTISDDAIDTLPTLFENAIYPAEKPTVLLIRYFDKIVSAYSCGKTRQFFSNIEQNLLPLVPSNYAILCLSDQAPGALTPDMLTATIWDQFKDKALFEVPSKESVARRLGWFFDYFVQHTKEIPELIQIQVAVTPEDLAWLSECANSHVMSDITYFCQRVFHQAVDQAITGPVIINRAFLEPLLYIKGAEKFKALAQRDCEREQWPYDKVAGKQLPIFNRPAPEPPRPETIEKPKDELFDQVMELEFE